MDRRLHLVGLCLMAITVASTGAPTFSGAQATQPGPGVKRAHYVGFVPPAFTDPLDVAMVDGARDQARKNSWKIDLQAPATEGDAASQAIIIQQFLQKGVEAIAINALNLDAVAANIRAANAANVPVFVYNSISPISEASAIVTSYIGFDQWAGAEKLGNYTCQLLARKYATTPEKAHGKVFILLGVDGVSTHRRTQGYKAGLAVCPGVQVAGEQSAAGLREQGAVVATAALQRTPDIDVFYGTGDEMNIGAALAAERLGLRLGTDFFSLGIGGSKPSLDFIRQGQITATLGIGPTRIGETVVNAMAMVLNGGTVPAILLTPTVVVDTGSLDDYLAGKTWTEPVVGSPEYDDGKPTVQTSSPSATAAATSATLAPTTSK